ncbi:putative nucleoid-associated protein YbaB [Gammaproteobacteria bacterium]
MRGPLANLMKQAQQMQTNLRKIQEEMAALEVTGQSGGGMVSVVMTGRHEVRRIQIEPDLMKEEKEMLEDLIAAAINDAVRKVEESTSGKMSAATSGLGLPPGFKLPF